MVDIEGAFKDAAKRAEGAMEPLKNTVDKVTKQLGEWSSMMRESKIGSDEFIVAAKNIQAMTERLAEAEYQLKSFSTNEGSIRAMSNDLAELERRWAEMGDRQKYAAEGSKELSAEAKSLVQQYKDVTAQIEKEGKSLRDLAAEEEKINRAIKKSAQSRKTQDLILKTSVKSIQILSAQYSILSERIKSVPVGSPQFKALATQLQQVSAELKKAQAAASGTKSAIESTGAASDRARTSLNATNQTLKRQSALWMQLRSLAGMYISVFGGLRFLGNIRKTTSELEMQRIALGGIIQDVDKANDLFRQIKAAALKSPFEIKDLVTYTKQLSAYRIETGKLFDVTMRLADVSAGLGVDMNRLILAYGQVRAASVLRGQELRQFTEAGIPLVELLADKFTKLRGEMVSTGEVFELISKRAVPFKMIEEIFNDMTSAGGIFYRMQEKQSETLKGQWMKLKDAATIMYDEIGNTKGVHTAMEDLIQNLLSLTRNWREVARWIAVGTSSMLAFSITSRAASVASAALTKTEAMRLAVSKKHAVVTPKLISAIIGETTAKKINRIATKQLLIAQTKLAAANNLLSKSLWKLYAAFLSNPYAWAAAAVVGLVGGVIALVKNNERARVSAESLESALASLQTQTTKTQEALAMADVYDELSQKASLSAEEQAKLDRVSRDLAHSFSGVVSGADNASNALVINTEKVRELATAEQELAIARLRATASEAKFQIPDLEKEREKLLKKATQGVKADLWGGREFLSADELEKIQSRIIEITEEIRKYKNALEEVDAIDFIGPLPQDNGQTEEQLKTWKKTIAEIQKEKVAAGATEIFSSDDIAKFESVLKFSAELKKKRDEVSQSLKTNIELLKTATDETRASIEADKIADENTLKMINAMAVAVGIVFKAISGGRDTRLSQLKSDISELTNAYKKFEELKKYKTEDEALIDINKLFPQLEGKIPSLDNVVSELEKRLEQVKKDLARSPKSKTLLDMKRALETEISNLKFDDLKNEIKKKLERVSDDLKRSETARKFYEDILELTGDESLASSLQIDIYGDIGKDFKDRLQEQLNGALEALKISRGGDVTDEIKDAFSNMDFAKILDIADLPEEVEKVVRDAYDKMKEHNADWVKDLMKTYQKSKTYEERITDIQNREATKREQIASNPNLSPELKQTYTDASIKKENEDIAKVQLEALKDTYTWTKAFENLEGVSTLTIKNLIKLIDEYVEKYGKDLEPQQLKELKRNKEQAEAQLIARNSWGALSGSIKNYIAAIKQKKQLEDSGQATSEQYAKAVDDEQKAIKDLSDSLAAINDGANTAMSSVKGLLNTFASSEDAEYFSEQMDNLAKTMSGVSDAAVGIARIASGDLSPQAFLQAGTGLAGIVEGVYNMSAAAQMRKWTNQIKEQDTLVRRLESSYNKLERAMEKSFGNDYLYNYNEAMENLLATQEAYAKQVEIQMEASQNASRKADRDNAAQQAEELQEKVDETATQIEDLREKMAETFVGTSLTSAAEEFAEAWLEAYREFGNTSEAIKEKMQDMINNLIVKSSLAKVAETILSPFYKKLEEYAREGTLVDNLSGLIDLLGQTSNQLNTGLNATAQILQANGVSMRGTVGSLSGISRDIASASEESILALAAGINTQNFYMSYVPTISADLRQIVDLMSIGTGQAVTTTAPPEGPVMPSVQEMVYDHLPNIDRNMAELLRLVSNVVKPNGTSAPYYVATKM